MMTTQHGTVVVEGIGWCLPPRVVSNDEVARRGGLDISDAWIRSRTGIATRRHAGPGVSTGDLAVGAGRAALRSGGGGADLLVLATTTPDRPCPATAPEVAHRLGLGEVAAFDVASVCSGFVYALTVAAGLVRGGVCRAPLVIAAETYSTILDPHDRGTAPIFGDGAGAVLLRPGYTEEPGAVIAVELGADGAGSDLIAVAGGGSRHPAGGSTSVASPPAADHRIRVQGQAVYRQAVRRMADSAATVLDRAGWPADTVDAFIGHQANQRILDAVADRVGIRAGSRFGNIAEVGNTAAASIPVALAHTAAHAQVPPGGRGVLTAFGGGLSWGSVALSWPAAVPYHAVPVPRAAARDLESAAS